MPKTKKVVIFQKQDYHVVSVSGGKDSTATLVTMIEKDMPIDAAFNADTGMEFPEMYEHLAQLDDYLYRERGIHITTLRHPKGFEWMMFEAPLQDEEALQKREELGLPLRGYGWPGVKVRWCTGQLKTHLINKEINRLKGERNVKQYIGIAADEQWRCKDANYPLVDFKITERQALQIDYEHGFRFGGLYRIYRRASCWCCPFQRVKELENLRKHHPELWAKLREMDLHAREQFGPGPLGQFRADYTVEQLERRFSFWDNQLQINR